MKETSIMTDHISYSDFFLFIKNEQGNDLY